MNNDLISREALRNDLITFFPDKCLEGITAKTLFKQILTDIGNAPTVSLQDIYQEGHYDGYLEGYTKAINEERPQGEWIPVSERLPEEKEVCLSDSDFGFDFEEVLCTTIWGDVRAYKFGKPIGHDKPHFWFYGGIMDGYVIAWQPLPEPYKKGGAE